MNSWQRVLLSAFLLLGAWLFLQFRSYGEAVPISKPLSDFPVKVEDWEGQGVVVFEDDILKMLKLKDYIMRQYVHPSGRSLSLYIGYWDSQRRGGQMHSPKHCLPGNGWDAVEAKIVSIPVSSHPSTIEVNYYLLQKDHYQQLVMYWYQSRGQVVASELAVKLQLLRHALFYNRTDGALVRIISPVRGSVQETFEQEVRYIQAMYPLLNEFLPD